MPLGLRLQRDRLFDIFVAVALVSYIDMMASPHIVADINREMTDDSRSTTDQTSITNPNNWVRQTFLTRHHACREGDILTDHRLLADLNIFFVEYRRKRKQDNRAFAKFAKCSRSLRIWTNGGCELEFQPKRCDALTKNF